MLNLNPIGYTAQTSNGNSYKKSNLGKTVGIVVAVGVGLVQRKLNRPFLGFMWSDQSLKMLFESFGKKINISESMTKFLRICDNCTDIIITFGLGVWADRYINKKRAKQADSMDNKGNLM